MSNRLMSSRFMFSRFMPNRFRLNKPSRFFIATVKSITLMLILALGAPASFALPEDSQQPIVIKSNSAVRDDKLGVTIYSGNVNMEQGSMRITADTVTLHAENDNITKIIATGNENQRASFKQQPQPNEGDVEADADTIEYQVNTDVITLLDNASLKQSDGSMISSNKIIYDANAARVEAGGQNGQVETVINPRNTFE